MDKTTLIHTIGEVIVSDPKVNTEHWDAYAMIAHYEDNSLRLSGFAYVRDEPYRAATAKSERLPELFNALREATQVEDKAPWLVCIIRIVRNTQKITADFVYDDDSAWKIAPATLKQVVERAKPEF